MTGGIFARGKRTSATAFWVGTLASTVGVGLHVPMFLDAASMNYRLAGMPMDPMMVLGMLLIAAGTLAAGYGLLPRAPHRRETNALAVDPGPSERGDSDERLTPAHWKLMLTLVMALVIDTMKPATLGFVVPGMVQEYGLSRPAVAILPLFALTGTMIGSFLWGYLADLFGRRAAILMAAIMFIGTAICGAMPSFTWNIVMCFFMGLSAGGMLPITYTLLAETIPAKHRGWLLVLAGGLGLVGGYFAASGSAALLEPRFGWRIMWFLGLPTGLLLVVLNQWIPESPRFLWLQGRADEARAILARFKAALPSDWGSAVPALPGEPSRGHTPILLQRGFAGTTATLNLAALAWGLVNFGLLLWLPADLRAQGFDVAGSDSLLAQSSILALPTVLLTAWLYARWSTRGTLIALSILTAIGLFGIWLLGNGIPLVGLSPVVLFAILMTGSNGVIAVLLPYSAETYPSRVRGRGTGFVAGSSKLGGIAAQAVSMAALVPALATAAMVLALPVMVSAFMVARFCRETRGQKLEELD